MKVFALIADSLIQIVDNPFGSDEIESCSLMANLVRGCEFINEIFEIFKLFEIPINRKRIEAEWVFKVKENEQGKVNWIKFKSRLVVKGYL